MDRNKTKTENRQRRYIRITDEDMWAKIDKIMTLDKYSKSFNKVIVDALYYGLDALSDRLFGTAEVERSAGTNPGRQKTGRRRLRRDFRGKTVRQSRAERT